MLADYLQLYRSLITEITYFLSVRLKCSVPVRCLAVHLLTDALQGDLWLRFGNLTVRAETSCRWIFREAALERLFEPLSSSPGHHQSLQEGLAEAQLALDSRVDVLGLTQCSQDILVVKIPP